MQIYLAETGLRHFISHGSDCSHHISVTTNLDQRGKDDSETTRSAVVCVVLGLSNPQAGAEILWVFSGLATTEHLIPSNDTGKYWCLIGARRRAQNRSISEETVSVKCFADSYSSRTGDYPLP